MAGRGDVARSRTQAGARRQHEQTPSLPIDIVLEIAACSDPATLVRCAATCREVRSRFTDDPTFRGRLRLRHTDRFVLPLLRGHFVGKFFCSDPEDDDVRLVDTTAADATCRLITADECFASGPNGEHLMNWLRIRSMWSREGLLLIRTHKELRVCDPATRLLAVTPETLAGHSKFSRHGWRRQNTVLHDICISKLFLLSMVHGAPTPKSGLLICSDKHTTRRPSDPLVVDGVVHWLCLTDIGGYVLMLNVKAARVTLTTLPTIFPHINKPGRNISYLLATNSACGSPIVLVADEEKISIWVQSKHTKRWKDQPQVVIKNEEIPRFNNVGDLLEDRPGTDHVHLEWFAERSGAVLIYFPYRCFFWLDLQSKKIVRWYPDGEDEYNTVYCPYEMDLSSWVPTFTSRL
ncbi:hypothetical protein EJB05_10693, partial [Eragrostis curvula]